VADPCRSASPSGTIPGAGKLSGQELQGISPKSRGVLRELGTEIQGIESYVAGDEIHRIHRAPGEEHIRRHAEQGGFPADRVGRIERVIDPTTADA
jgi:Protein of unknown function (DUF4242)